MDGSFDPESERAYLQRRAAAHRTRALASRDGAERALHERFAALYAARADLIVVP